MNRTQFSSLISKGGKKMKHVNKMNGKKKMANGMKKKKNGKKKMAKKGAYGK